MAMDDTRAGGRKKMHSVIVPALSLVYIVGSNRRRYSKVNNLEKKLGDEIDG